MERDWRFIDTGVNDAYLNMAIDEAILDAHIKGLVSPTLRVYRWDPPALSLGYSQAIEPEVDLVKCRELGIDVVRRLTGGRAVLHDRELTYSLVVSVKHGFPESVIGSYRLLSRGLIACYRILGLDVDLKPGQRNLSSAACFQAATLADLTYQGRKLAGSAQVRRKDVLLQHGSLPINSHCELLFSLLRFPSDVSRQKARSFFNKKMVTLGEVVGRNIDWQELKEALTRGFREALDIRFHEGNLKAEEIRQSQELAVGKYSTYEWNHRK